MAECYVTLRDVRTRFNPNFHMIKIKNIEAEIEEMYHLGTTITNYDYDLGFMNTRSMSAEDVAVDILSKRKHLDRARAKHQRYLNIHERALEKVIRHISKIETFQSGIYTLDEVAKIFNVKGQAMSHIMTKYRQALSDIMTEGDTDSEPISNDEIEQLSAVIDENVMFVPEDREHDPLRSMYKWAQADRKKRQARRKAEMSAV